MVPRDSEGSSGRLITIWFERNASIGRRSLASVSSPANVKCLSFGSSGAKFLARASDTSNLFNKKIFEPSTVFGTKEKDLTLF